MMTPKAWAFLLGFSLIIWLFIGVLVIIYLE